VGKPAEVTLRKPKLGILDALVLLALAAGAAYVFYRVRDGLHYRWEWEAIPQYLLRREPGSGAWAPNVLLQGFLATLRLSLWATLLASLIGTAMGLLRLSADRFLRWVGFVYVELVRNTPSLVLVFLFYYFLGEQWLPSVGMEAVIRRQSPEIQWLVTVLLAPPGMLTAFISAVITLSVVEGAYITEIVRAGIQSIERGQREAAAALGLTRWQCMRHVLLPQAVQRILPPLGGQFISTIKDSAIVSVISVPELTFRGMELMSATYLTFETWITITGLYFVLTFGCSLMFARIETAWRRARV
jgi:polar amino acid transport system permease protein